MKHNQIVDLCNKFNVVPIDKDFFFKDKNGEWIIDSLDCCMWTKKGFSFDGGRHCSSLAFIENAYHSGMTKSQIWDSIAESIKFEGNDVDKCNCNDCKKGK